MRKTACQISIEGYADRVPCPRNVSVLKALEARGLARIPIGCRGGGCGICKIRVVSGEYRTGKMATCHVSDRDRQKGYVLACRLYPDSDLRIILTDQGATRSSVDKTGPGAMTRDRQGTMEHTDKGEQKWQ